MASPQRSTVTIVVVGDSGVGKTSLITTLVSGIFPETVPSVLQQVRIAPEDTADELGVLIVDTSSEEIERENLFDRVVRSADVVICVHDVTAPETFDRLAKVWLDRISTVFHGPIVVVGNKIDLLPPSSSTYENDKKESKDATDRLRAKVRPLLEKYHVDAALDCSAKTNVHVTDLFYYAQHAVIFPVHPLLDVHNGRLLPKFRRALTRVFRFYDEDHDDHLSNSELNTFQEQCFGARLPHDDLDGIKSVLQKESATFVEPRGITLEGFQFLFQLFIQRNRPETAWSVLRKFGYDDALVPHCQAQTLLKSLVRDQSVELTKRGLAFFAGVFHQFDRDNDGALSNEELDEIFTVCGEPGFRPWTHHHSNQNQPQPRAFDRSLANLEDFPDGCLTSSERRVTLSGWLAQWAMTTSISPSLALQQLELLGFPDLSVSSSIKFTRKRSLEDNDNRLQRTVVRAFCFGAKGVGKSSLLNGLVKKSPAAVGRESGPRSACGTVRPLDSSHQPNTSSQASWFLILTEVPSEDQKDFFAPTSSSRLDCDLAVFLFDADDMESVEFLRSIQASVPPTVPCVYLANKRQQSSPPQQEPLDEEESLENKREQADLPFELANELCKAYSLSEPDVISLEFPVSEQAVQKWSQGMDKIFGLLMTTALFPGAARPISDAQRVVERQKRLVRSVKRVSLVLGLIGGLSYFAYWVLSKRNESSSSSTYPRTRGGNISSSSSSTYPRARGGNTNNK